MQDLYVSKKQIFVLLLAILFIPIIILPISTAAASTSAERAAEICQSRNGEWDETQESCDYGPCELDNDLVGIIPTWYKYLGGEKDSTGKCNVVLSGSDTEGKVNSALPIGIALLEAVLRLAGLVAVVMVFWGGFKYITALGNPDNAKAARSTIINALIGLVIVIVSTTLVSYIGGIIS